MIERKQGQEPNIIRWVPYYVIVVLVLLMLLLYSFRILNILVDNSVILLIAILMVIVFFPFIKEFSLLGIVSVKKDINKLKVDVDKGFQQTQSMIQSIQMTATQSQQVNFHALYGREIEEALRDMNRYQYRIPGLEDQHLDEPRYRRFKELQRLALDDDPKMQVAKSRIVLEQQLAKLAELSGIKDTEHRRKWTFTGLLEGLFRERVIDERMYSSVRRIWEIGTMAIHGMEITSGDAELVDELVRGTLAILVDKEFELGRR